MRVVFVVLDAFPNSVVDPILTPNLHRLIESGGRQAAGGVADMTAATYPNHATFVTGTPTIEHGVITNNVLRDGVRHPAAQVGPATPTLFEACRAEGRASAVVVGDQNLIGVCLADRADVHWPPGGEIPDGARRSEGGYLVDAEVIAALDRLDLAALDVLFVQLDEVDSVRHRHGAWGEAAMEQCHRTDGALGELIDRLRPGWDDTVVMVVSDHDQEDVDSSAVIDFRAELAPDCMVDYQGTAALVVGRPDQGELLALPGVAGSTSLDETHHVVWGAPGQLFGWDFGLRGEHGSPRTAIQLAVIGGGHPRAAALAAELSRARPPATAWAHWMAESLELRWRPGSDPRVGRGESPGS